MTEVIDLDCETITVLYRRGDGKSFKIKYPDGYDLTDHIFSWQFRKKPDDAEPAWEMDVDYSHASDDVAPHVIFSIPEDAAQSMEGVYVSDIQVKVGASLPLTLQAFKQPKLLWLRFVSFQED